MRHGLVIIGGSHAGVQIAAKVRELGFLEPITIVGDEPALPYQRPPLSKAFLLKSLEDRDLRLRSPEFYRDNNIELVVGRRCERIAPGENAVYLDEGKRLPYDWLALTVGARARSVPNCDPGPRVLQLRNLSDAIRMKETASHARRVVVIGGGFIGLEVASSLSALNCEVVVVEFQQRLLARSCSSEIAQFVARKHRSHGVTLRMQVGVQAIHQTGGDVDDILLSDGSRLGADLIILGVGATPNVELAQAAGIVCENGVAVDEYARTSVPNIVAAGDCTSFIDRRTGCRVRMECIQNANDQAAIAAATIVGQQTPYTSVPWFWSDQHGFKMQMAGSFGSSNETVIRGRDDAFSVWHFVGSRLAGVETINKPADHMLARKLLATNASVEPNHVADPTFDLRSLTKAI